MASSSTSPTSFSLFFLFYLLLLSSWSTTIDTAKLKPFSTRLPMKLKDKLSHLHFYFHDTLSGRNPTAVPIAGPRNLTARGYSFGTLIMVDDPLTQGPNPTSKLVGKAQGMYAAAAQNELGLLMLMSFAFKEGKYNGSTISILGRNPATEPVREMPIVGGSGLFRFARGYALARTRKINLKTGDAVVEYNVFVMHY